MKNVQERPWLNDDGSIKSTEEIKRICQSWTPQIWNEYLGTLEVAQKEDYTLSPSIMETFSPQESVELMFSMASEEQYPFLKVALKACIEELSPKQREIIRQYYWEQKTIVQIAENLGTSKQAVSKRMKTALSNLKEKLESGLVQRKVMAAKDMAKEMEE